MQIELRVEAKNDLVHGANFYELQRGGLCDKFIDAVVDSLEAPRWTAGIHAIVMGYHRRIVDRFPFAIYYRLEETTVDVVAILDLRRDPDSITARLARTW